MLNVMDFGAKGDGITDDTLAINQALAASGEDTRATFWKDRIVYFPKGTYLVSSPLTKHYSDGKFASGAILQGHSSADTIIKLSDGNPGYSNISAPRAVIYASSKLEDATPTSGGKDYNGKGEGNDAYMNYVENLTIDVGEHNPGAIGIDYLASNMGAVRHVVVKAGGDSGAVGIALTRKWPGPLLMQDVMVKGFAVGIDVANTEYGVTMENIELSGQTRIGIRNNHNEIALHNLIIKNAPVPIVNAAYDGLIVLDTAKIMSSDDNPDAIENGGLLNLHNVDVKGYKNALGESGGNMTLNGVYQESRRLGSSRPHWTIPAKSPPSVFSQSPANWASVEKYGARPDSLTDSTASIRRAFASGAATIYFPHGIYLISDNIVIPSSVRRIVGMTSTIYPFQPRAPAFKREWGMFRVRNDETPLTIEKLAFDHSWLGDQVGVEALGIQPLVLRDVVGAGTVTLKRPKNGGEVYVENTCCGTIDVEGEKGIWFRQLDTEGEGVRMKNNGARLWVLGLKTEGDCTVVENTNGAATEILGGLVYIVKPKADPSIPAFRNIDSHMALSYMEESFDVGSVYTVHLEDISQGKPTLINASSLPRRSIGRMVPELISR